MVGLLWSSYSKLSRPIHKGTTHGRPEKLVTDPVKSNKNGGFVFAAHFSSNFVAFSPARTGLLRIFPSPFEWVHLFDRFLQCNPWSQQSSNLIQKVSFVNNQSSDFLLDSDRISSCFSWRSIPVPVHWTGQRLLSPISSLPCTRHDKQTTVILNYPWLLYKGTKVMEWRSIQAKRAKSKEWEDMAWYWLGSSRSDSKLHERQRWAEPISLHVI